MRNQLEGLQVQLSTRDSAYLGVYRSFVQSGSGGHIYKLVEPSCTSKSALRFLSFSFRSYHLPALHASIVACGANMVWKPKKSRRGDCRGTIPSAENGSGPRQLRSCLKVGPDEKIFVQCKQSESTIGQDSTCNPRDNSIRSSSRSILGMMSASVSSWSRDTPPPEENVRCNGSITSADSAISARNSTDKIPQQNSVVSRVSAESRTVKFGSILIREHERAVGDNPSCSTGPPIGYVVEL